jgi:membrane protease YdiL (CAAX protease family)
MSRSSKKETTIKNATILATYLLIVWGFYRFLFKLPEEPVFWLIPVFLLLKREKKGLSSLGVTMKNLFPAIYVSLALGVVFAIEGVIINYVKYSGIDFSANVGQRMLFAALGLSFVTAISEELTLRGYLFSRIWDALGNEVAANLITSFVWGLIHIPIAVFWFQLEFGGIVGYLLLTTIFGIGSAYVYARTKNIVSSILLHVLWAWPIILFR